MRRSMLFIPGNSPNLLMNADVLGSDSIILDLEDAVAPAEKDSARILVRNAMAHLDWGRCEVIVRINSLDTDFWRADLDTVVPHRPNWIMLPKTALPQHVQTVDTYLSQLEAELGLPNNSVRLMPLIETALGVENAFAIASASKRVGALFLGAEDLTADLQCKRTKESREIEYARGRMVVAARAAGVDVYDTPFTDVNDAEGMEADARYAKAMGFTGKAAISPRHVEIINRVFSPTLAEIEYAYEVLDAIAMAKAQGRGAISLRGKMIDAPIVNRAKQTIAAAEELGLGKGAAQ